MAEVFSASRDVFATAFSWAHENGVKTAVGSETPLVQADTGE